MKYVVMSCPFSKCDKVYIQKQEQLSMDNESKDNNLLVIWIAGFYLNYFDMSVIGDNHLRHHCSCVETEVDEVPGTLINVKKCCF